MAKRQKTKSAKPGRPRGAGAFQKVFSLRLPLVTYEQAKTLASSEASDITQILRTVLVREIGKAYGELPIHKKQTRMCE